MRLNDQDIIELYFRYSIAANSPVAGQVWPKIKLIKALIVVLDICKNDEDPSKMKAQVWCSHHYSHYKSMETFSDIQGQPTP